MLSIGGNIESAGPFTPDATSIGSGTSFSAAFVSGAIALMMGERNLTPAELTTKLFDLSTKGVVVGIDATTPNRLLRVPNKGVNW